MEKLSARKRIAIVRDYLSGLPYREIAARQHVSIGAVTGVVTDLKEGRFPEAGDIGEHIEQLKELSIDLKKANLTPGQCAMGFMVMARIKECGLEPSDIDRWPLILKSVADEDEAQRFVKMVYDIQVVEKRTGLSFDALDDKVHELEKKAAELEPMSIKLDDGKKEVAKLTRQRKELSSEVANLEERRGLLYPELKELEKREKDLLSKLADMESRAKRAEVTLATISKETKKLQDIGFTFEELASFNQKLQAIARRRAIKPSDLRGRLLHELRILDKGLGMEELVEAKQVERKEIEKAVTKVKKELETTKKVVGILRQEQIKIEASIKETREQVVREITGVIPVARNTVNQLAKELHNEVDKAIAGVGQLRDQSLETGKEVGRYEEILENNVWLKELFALVKGEPSIEAKQVRTIALLVARGVSSWLRVQDKYSTIFTSLSRVTNKLIEDFEQWKV